MEKIHLGFIVDGNRRWAREKNLPTLAGHQKGFDNVEMVIEELAKHDEVGYASFYLFSTENWNRAKEEVDYLMKLAQKKISSITKKLAKNNLRCVIMGSEEHVPESLLKALRKCEEETKSCTGMTVCICFNYGGKQEIADAAKAVAKAGEEFTPESIEKHLYHPEVPACDMIIRTSGEERISGFMLWRAAYSEFLFLKQYFPDIEKSDIEYILNEYKNRNRRFGK